MGNSGCRRAGEQAAGARSRGTPWKVRAARAARKHQHSQRNELQKIPLKREVAGTSRIEGAEFTEKELDAAMRETPEQLETRSQKQAVAALATYRWIARLEADRPLDEALILEVHRRLVTGCDDDHCPPGRLRERDQNVIFGTPRHRGCEGGGECEAAIGALVAAARTAFCGHDALIQALALHYHFAAMHPFLDGNGRTARALKALNDTRAAKHELTPFLKFALRGIESQCRRLFGEIKLQVAKALYRNTVTDLFGRLETPRKRVLSDRHVQLLNLLLDEEEITLAALTKRSAHFYPMKNPYKALIRDLNYLIALNAIAARRLPEDAGFLISILLEWPTQITETEFFAG